MFEPMEITSDELREELLFENNWEKVCLWFQEVPKIVQASTSLLNIVSSDLVTEI